jgi:hypothetical protein
MASRRLHPAAPAAGSKGKGERATLDRATPPTGTGLIPSSSSAPAPGPCLLASRRAAAPAALQAGPASPHGSGQPPAFARRPPRDRMPFCVLPTDAAGKVAPYRTATPREREQEPFALPAAARARIPSAGGPSTCIIMHLYIASWMHASAAMRSHAICAMADWRDTAVPGQRAGYRGCPSGHSARAGQPGRGRLYPVVAGAMRGPGAVARARCPFCKVPGTAQACRAAVGEAQRAVRRLLLKRSEYGTGSAFDPVWCPEPQGRGLSAGAAGRRSASQRHGRQGESPRSSRQPRRAQGRPADLIPVGRTGLVKCH